MPFWTKNDGFHWKTKLVNWVKTNGTPGEHQNRGQMDVHPPQNGIAIGDATHGLFTDTPTAPGFRSIVRLSFYLGDRRVEELSPLHPQRKLDHGAVLRKKKAGTCARSSPFFAQEHVPKIQSENLTPPRNIIGMKVKAMRSHEEPTSTKKHRYRNLTTVLINYKYWCSDFKSTIHGSNIIPKSPLAILDHGSRI